jgi:hypothetical protein
MKPRNIKETASRDFRRLFFHKSTVPKPLVNTLKYFRIPFQIRGDIRPQTVKKSTPRYATYSTLIERQIP